MSRLSGRSPASGSTASKKLSFTFDGKRVEAYEGDTIGSALYAAGQRTFSRSFKYHRRRGLMCCAGQCPNCIVAVDGAPGARACTEPVREGIKVQHVNAASLEFDPMRATDVVGGPFTPPGFYYKTFIRPRRLWPLYEKVLRNAAGLGKLRHEQHRTRVADRVPPPPRRRAGRRRRDRGPAGGERGGRAGRRRGARRRGPRARRPAADRAPATSRSDGCSRAPAPPESRSSSARRRSATSTGWCRSGSRTRCTRCAPSATSSPPERSSSRWCSRATTCPA